MLTRDDFLAPPLVRVKAIKLRDGRTAFIRAPNEGEYAEYQAVIWSQDAAGNLTMAPGAMARGRRKLVELGLADESGARLLKDGDADRLVALDAATILDLADQIRRHAGFDELTSVEDQAKNSNGGPG